MKTESDEVRLEFRDKIAPPSWLDMPSCWNREEVIWKFEFLMKSPLAAFWKEEAFTRPRVQLEQLIISLEKSLKEEVWI